MTLAEALAQVDLEPGRTYSCLVNGKRVTVRVVPASALEPAARYDESDVMLDPVVRASLAGQAHSQCEISIGSTAARHS